MSFVAKVFGNVPPDSIRTKASAIIKTGYKNTQREAWKVFYFYSKLTLQIVKLATLIATQKINHAQDLKTSTFLTPFCQ